MFPRQYFPLFPLSALLSTVPWGETTAQGVKTTGWRLMATSVIATTPCFILLFRWSNLEHMGNIRFVLYLQWLVISGVSFTHGLSLALKAKPWANIFNLLAKKTNSSQRLYSPNHATILILTEVVGLLVLEFYPRVLNWWRDEHSAQLNFESLVFALSSTLITWENASILMVQCSILEFTCSKLVENTENLQQAKTVEVAKAGVDEYNKLLRVVELISELFGLQIFFFCSATIIGSIIHGSFLIKRGKSASEILTITFLLTMLIISNYWCERTQDKVKTFQEDLLKMVTLHKWLYNDEYIVFCTSVKRTVSISALGFFELGFPLLISMTAATLTYLVLTMQLH